MLSSSEEVRLQGLEDEPQPHTGLHKQKSICKGPEAGKQEATMQGYGKVKQLLRISCELGAKRGLTGRLRGHEGCEN